MVDAGDPVVRAQRPIPDRCLPRSRRQMAIVWLATPTLAWCRVIRSLRSLRSASSRRCGSSFVAWHRARGRLRAAPRGGPASRARASTFSAPPPGRGPPKNAALGRGEPAARPSRVPRFHPRRRTQSTIRPSHDRHTPLLDRTTTDCESSTIGPPSFFATLVAGLTVGDAKKLDNARGTFMAVSIDFLMGASVGRSWGLYAPSG